MYIKALGSGEWGTQHNMRCQSWAGCKVEQAANWALGQKWWHFLLHPRHHPLSMLGPTFVEGNLKNLPRSWAPALLPSAHLPPCLKPSFPRTWAAVAWFSLLRLYSGTMAHSGVQSGSIVLATLCMPLVTPSHHLCSPGPTAPSLLSWGIFLNPQLQLPNSWAAASSTTCFHSQPQTHVNLHPEKEPSWAPPWKYDRPAVPTLGQSTWHASLPLVAG